MGEVYGEEIEKAHIPMVKHFQFVLGTKPSHSQGQGNISLAKRHVDKQLFQSQIHNAQERAQDLELEVLKLSNIIQKQEETNMQLQGELQSQHELLQVQELTMKSQQDKMKQEIEVEMKQQMNTLLGGLSFSGVSNPLSISFNKVSCFNLKFIINKYIIYIFTFLDINYFFFFFFRIKIFEDITIYCYLLNSYFI